MGGATLIRDPLLEEVIHRRVFPSGLTVYAVRKREFSRSYATLATRYGSIDARLPGRRAALPDGIAHFLEHKVFETPDGDAFDLFAARGASANAFTSFGTTRYLFGTSTDYEENLATLLRTVFDLHVTEANVEKEKGIIGQEIGMYEDDADWRIYFGALQALYSRNPVRIDIAGTAKTIAAITPALLREVHAAYYHPRNMVLACVSPEPEATTFRTVEREVEGRTFGRAPEERRPPPREPLSARRRRVELALPVRRPRLLLAFKDSVPGRTGTELLRRELASAVALDCLFGSSGSIFLDLYEQGLVDESFTCSYSAEPSFAYAMVGGEVDDVEKVRKILDAAIEAARRKGLTKSDLERVRNKEIGDFARAFNSPDRIAQMLVGHHYRKTTVPEYRDQLMRLSLARVNRRLRDLLDPRVRCYSIVRPR